MIAQTSMSLWSSLSCSILSSMEKSVTSFGHFCNLPLTTTHVFQANGHSHSTWQTVSGCCLQNSHREFTTTFLLCKFSLVGNMFKHARHRKFWTFRGTLRVQICFQIFSLLRLLELSPLCCYASLNTTWYADLRYVWEVRFALPSTFTFLLFFFFFFFSRKVWLFNQFSATCESRALFMDPQISLFSNFFIKNESHNTIYTFKNYFATVFFSFRFSAVSKRSLNREVMWLIHLPDHFILLLHPCEWYRQNFLASNFLKQSSHFPSIPLLRLLINKFLYTHILW